MVKTSVGAHDGQFGLFMEKASGVVAAGNPCRVLRKITEEDKVGFPA